MPKPVGLLGHKTGFLETTVIGKTSRKLDAKCMNQV
jgi:hypothetical protein